MTKIYISVSELYLSHLTISIYSVINVVICFIVIDTFQVLKMSRFFAAGSDSDSDSSSSGGEVETRPIVSNK